MTIAAFYAYAVTGFFALLDLDAHPTCRPAVGGAGR